MKKRRRACLCLPACLMSRFFQESWPSVGDSHWKKPHALAHTYCSASMETVAASCSSLIGLLETASSLLTSGSACLRRAPHMT